MKIGVQNNLIHIKQALEEKGYSVTNGENFVDVFIYDGKDYEGLLSAYNNEENHGVFMINCHNKDIDQIEYMISEKSYSRLF